MTGAQLLQLRKVWKGSDGDKALEESKLGRSRGSNPLPYKNIKGMKRVNKRVTNVTSIGASRGEGYDDLMEY